MTNGHAEVSTLFQRLLVVCTGNEEDETTLAAALRFVAAAREVEADPEVRVLSVVDRKQTEDFICTLGGASQSQLDALRRVDRRAQVDAQLADLAPDLTQDVEVVVGKTFVEIIRDGVSWQADLIIKPMTPLSLLHGAILGSTDMHLIRKSPVPVLITRAVTDAPETPQVFAAVDLDTFGEGNEETGGTFSEAALNEEILAAAIRLCRAYDASLVLIHSWQAPAEGLLQRAAPGVSDGQLRQYVKDVEHRHKAALDDLVARAREMAGPQTLSVSGRLLRGDAEDCLPEEANRAKPVALVMGTVGRTGLEGVIIGNTAENVLTGIDVPVLAVKPPGFESPIRLA